MSNEPKPTTIKEDLVECDKCGSTDWCMTQELSNSFIWIHCRQCDNVFGLAKKQLHQDVY